MFYLLLITFTYQGATTLRSSLKDAYHMLMWAQKRQIKYDWYIDQCDDNLIFDPTMAQFLNQQPKNYITDSKQLSKVLNNMRKNTLCCITAHGSKQGLILKDDTLLWLDLYKSIKQENIFLLLDCCHCPSYYPLIYKNSWIYNKDVQIYPNKGNYMITACNNQGVARNNANGSYLINYFLNNYKQKLHLIEDWQLNFNSQYPCYYLQFTSNVIYSHLLPLWLFYPFDLNIEDNILLLK